MSKGIRSLLLN